MSDPIVPDPASQTPPAAPAAPVYAPAPVAGKRALSLTSFILGIVGFVLAFPIAGIGIIAGIVAVVLGFIGRAKEPSAPKWMWLIGLILGFVAIVLSIIAIIITAAAVTAVLNNPNYKP